MMLRRIKVDKDTESSEIEKLNTIPEDILILLFTFLGDRQTFESIHKIKALTWGALLVRSRHRIYSNLLRENYSLEFSDDVKNGDPDTDAIYKTIDILKKIEHTERPEIFHLSLFVKVINRILRLKDDDTHLPLAKFLLEKIHVRRNELDFAKRVFVEAAKNNCSEMILFAVGNSPYNLIICGYDTCHYLSLSEADNIEVLKVVIDKLLDHSIGKTCNTDDTTCPGNDIEINLLHVYKKLAQYGAVETIKNLMTVIHPLENWRQVLQTADKNQQNDVLDYLVNQKNITFFQNPKESCVSLSFVGLFSALFALILLPFSDSRGVTIAFSISAILSFSKIIFDKIADFKKDNKIREMHALTV